MSLCFNVLGLSAQTVYCQSPLSTQTPVTCFAPALHCDQAFAWPLQHRPLFQPASSSFHSSIQIYLNLYMHNILEIKIIAILFELPLNFSTDLFYPAFTQRGPRIEVMRHWFMSFLAICIYSTQQKHLHSSQTNFDDVWKHLFYATSRCVVPCSTDVDWWICIYVDQVSLFPLLAVLFHPRWVRISH